MRNPSARSTEQELFRSLEHRNPRGTAFSTSVVVHIILITVLVVLPLIFTETMKVKYDVVLIAPPMPQKQVLEVTPYRQPKPKPVERPPEKFVAPPPRKPLLADIKPPEPPRLGRQSFPR